MQRHLSYNLLNIFSRLFNFLLFWLVVNKLGASGETDWFFFVYGAVYFFISTIFFSLEFALVPTWPLLSSAEKEKFWRTCILFGLLGTLVLQLMGLAFSLYLPGLFGFSFPFSLGHTILLSFILFLQPPLAFFSALYSSLLQSSGRYFWPITHMSWRTLGVVPILLLPFCNGVTCVGIAYLVGELLRFSVLMRAEETHGIKFSLPRRMEINPFKKYFEAVGWMALMISSSVLNPYIDLVMVGRLAEGDATLVEYAARLRGMPVLFLSGTLTVLLGDWSRKTMRELSWDQVGRYAWIMGLCGLIMSVFLILSKGYWISLIFTVQKFDPHLLNTIHKLMVWYLLSTPFLLVTGTLGRGFMVLRQFRLLAGIGVLSIFVNVLLNVTFIEIFGVQGVAMSTALLDLFLSGAYFFLGKWLAERREEDWEADSRNLQESR
jgi:peptidoglycan biosynthesis protein MviN/MurJ (putative lipid II flippase)